MPKRGLKNPSHANKKKTIVKTFDLPVPSFPSYFRFSHSSLARMRHAAHVAGRPLLGAYPGFGIHSPMVFGRTPHSG
jgi:hypothetical protein